jgi:hypothetical protein
MPGWIKDPKDPRRPLVQEKGDYVSETFAKNSEAGKTHVVFPSHPGKGHDVYPYRRPDNVFDETEYPRLKHARTARPSENVLFGRCVAAGSPRPAFQCCRSGTPASSTARSRTA